MTNHNVDEALIERLLSDLGDRSLPPVDLDRLADQLRLALERIRKQAEQEAELQLLREDYIARIAGMLKAVAVAARSESGTMEAADRVEQLPNLSARDLVRQYRLAAARFRDAFPTSFRPFSGRAENLRNQRRIEDYK